jgi:hypothetical protein
VRYALAYVNMGDHLDASRDVPLNSSSNVQCHDPDGAATGGAVPAHGPRSAGAAGPGDVLGTAAGADARAAAGPGAPLCVEEYVVDPPPGDAETDDGGEEVVVVVVGLGHRSTICWYCVQSPRPVDPPPDPVAEPFARGCPEPGLPTSTTDKTTMSATPPVTFARTHARLRRLPRGRDTSVTSALPVGE